MEIRRAEMVEIESTKNRILYEALRLFSKKGYDGVSMREIAAAVGIKGASIYNHFKGKEDIFHAIFREIQNQYNAIAEVMHIPMEGSEEVSEAFVGVEEETLIYSVEALLNFFAQNEFVALFRKLLMSEQHKSEQAATYLKEYYLESPIEFQSQIFKGLQARGEFGGCDAKMLAVHFYSPIFYLLCQYDLGMSFEECLEMAKKHVSEFVKVHKSFVNLNKI